MRVRHPRPKGSHAPHLQLLQTTVVRNTCAAMLRCAYNQRATETVTTELKGHRAFRADLHQREFFYAGAKIGRALKSDCP